MGMLRGNSLMVELAVRQGEAEGNLAIIKVILVRFRALSVRTAL